MTNSCRRCRQVHAALMGLTARALQPEGHEMIQVLQKSVHQNVILTAAAVFKRASSKLPAAEAASHLRDPVSTGKGHCYEAGVWLADMRSW
jgi:hypothetical protein